MFVVFNKIILFKKFKFEERERVVITKTKLTSIILIKIPIGILIKLIQFFFIQFHFIFILQISMFQDPEMDFGYQEYWKKFPDDSEDTAKWIEQFRRNDDQIMIVEGQLQNDQESDEEDEDISFTQYHSPERMNNKRSSPTKQLNYSALNQNAARIIKEQEDDLISCPSFRSQVHKVNEILHPNGQESLASFSQMANFLNVQKGTFYTHLKRGEDVADTGRPSELTENEINEVISFVYQKYLEKNPATFESILYFLKERFDKDMIMKTLYGQLSRLPQLKSLDGVPMESDRVKCSKESIDKFYNDLESILSTRVVPSAFIMNLDEAGFAEWQDSARVTVIVPSYVSDEDIKCPVDRQGKRASLLVAIAADGSAFTPAVVVPRKTVETELYEFGYTTDKICYGYSETGFFSTELFEKWAFEYFFPEVRQRREKYKYSGECVLILDGFGPHDSDTFLNACSEEGIIPLFLAPHSSDQTQPLDIGFFGVQKGKMSRITVPSGLSQQTAQIIRIIDSFRQTSTISNIISAFRGAGIVSSYHPDHGLIPRVARSEAIRVRHWVNIQNDSFNKKRVHL